MISKDELFEKYNRKIDNILDVCDWKTHFTSDEVCGIIFNIITKENINLALTLEEFTTLYQLEVSKVWTPDMSLREITDFIHNLLFPKYSV